LFVAGILVALLAIAFWAATSAARQEGGGEIEAAEAAVRAWGVFATTGDLRSVAEAFAVGGPQYAQFLSELVSMVPDGEYSFALTEAALVSPGVVRGLVETTTPAGDLRTYQWDIELIRHANRWEVWTVRTSESEEPRT
jgi:hypothetical protein